MTCVRVANWRVGTTRLEQDVLYSCLGPVWPGACTSIVRPSSCLAVGRTEIVGSELASLVWGPCLVVGAQGDTLRAWVVKMLGGLSASARAQRALDSLVWGPCLVVGAQGDTVKAWVVKLLGGLSASARAQRTSVSLVWGPYQVVGAQGETLKCVGCVQTEVAAVRSSAVGLRCAYAY